MEEKKLKELQEIKKELDKFEVIKIESAKRILNIAKKNCTKYKDVESNLSILRRNLSFKQEDREKYLYLLDKVYVLLEEEKSDLTVTNHF